MSNRARRLYGQVFFGKPAAEDVKQSVEKDLAKGIARCARGRNSTRTSPGQSSASPIALLSSAALVSLATKHAYGRDFLEDIAQLKPYLEDARGAPAFRQVQRRSKAASVRAKK